jgi:hypothetical protein
MPLPRYLRARRAFSLADQSGAGTGSHSTVTVTLCTASERPLQALP